MPERTASTTFSDPLIGRQWHLGAIGVEAVWADYSGAGVLVGVFDDGVDRRHPDLADRFDAAASYDYERNRPGGEPVEADDNHGTAVAGLIAATADNGIGGAGVAHGASIASLRGLGIAIGDEARVFAASTELDILNNSWGYSGSLFFDDFTANPSFEGVAAALDTLVTEGRDGLGTVVVFAAGNGRQDGDDVNYHNLTNSRFTIAVAASDRGGEITSYSTPGAALLVTAPGGSGDIVTTDRVGADGYARGGDMLRFAGTSASAPILSGVVALMLEANPRLGYRDVQEILAYSARRSGRSDWQDNGADDWNGGGLHVSHDFGFGLVDAHAAVRLAETWSTGGLRASEVALEAADRFGAGRPIADGDVVTVRLALPALTIDHVEVLLDLEHDVVGDLRVVLTSPAGTESILIDRPLADGAIGGSFLLSSTRYWGESRAGDWTLSIEDGKDGGTGRLLGWTLTLYGDPVDADDRYVFTDEYASLAADADRQLLVDDAGKDSLQAAAVTADLDLDLRPGHVSMIAGKPLWTAAGTVIEDAFGGDGDDRIGGNGARNRLIGGRGDDRLLGRNEADVLKGGPGRDDLRGGDGDDRLHGGTGGDWLRGDAGADHLEGGGGSDLLRGRGGRDQLEGEGGSDELRGGHGADQLFGNRGHDLLIGGPGADELTGGRGRDSLYGGKGADSFLYAQLAERGDVIHDFTLGPDGDHLMLDMLLDGYRVGVSDPANFVTVAKRGAGLDVRVDADGPGGDDGVLLVTLAGLGGDVDLATLLADGNIVLA